MVTFRQYVAAINEHDVAAIAALMTTDHVFVDSLGTRTCGAASMEAGWRGYFAMCPDYWIRADHVIEENGVVLAAGEAGGTVDGVAWKTPAAWKATIRGRKVAEWQVFADNKPVYDIVAKRQQTIRNRSVLADTVLPHLVYANVAEALAWLHRTFGFTEHYRYGEPGGPVAGAQMLLWKACIMLRAARPGEASPAQVGHHTQSLTVFVDDVDAHYERTKSAGAKIVEELHETFYGERQYGVEDLEGHHWLFSQHARDVSPGEWGATLARS